MSDLTSARTVSVLIPCHNYGRFVGEALASVDSQSHRPSEILICDDGSTDDSWATIRQLIDVRDDVVALRHVTAHGLVSTLNELWRSSTGELIVPLSADDRFGPGYIEGVVTAMSDHGWDFAYTDMQCFGASSWHFVAPEMDVYRLARFNFIHGSSGLTRECLEAVGGYSPLFENGFEDYDFWLSAIEHGFTGGKAHGIHLDYRRHEVASRNTATTFERCRMRWMLARHHPRFFLHPRAWKAWLPSHRPIAGTEVPP